MAALAGQLVALTRPREQIEPLALRLEALGARVLRLPLIEIAPPEAPESVREFAPRLGQFDLAFFVSPNAVRHALDLLPRALWPATLRVAAVGPGTARALQEHGFCDVIVPASGFDSESVLALPAFADEAVARRRMLILRGNGGRELLADSLRQRGAEVELLGCYRRRAAPVNVPVLLSLLARGELAAMVFSSSEAVGFLAEALGGEARGLFSRLPLFASHPRIAEALRMHGGSEIVLTQPGDDGVCAALLARLGRP
ncbi:MAG: uroporphyrinogen III synthase [Candidatus Dactylopiibacterium carminicum]|uniref:Uroporphyrinogen-III synthase n=1 Tax=Candidatus Dactylopiibacterium carminicum TaxID=857335 RepID=A0A272ERC2_9RHOO|nr:uroporphyrinogen-III synthase [Candidatus Dactylopiibacterium carminicum]KAF7598720.1 uroporphyrinogen-III synthase [Candidatus Dactylopiibacterium carminicum]PAS92632.1 MAG: uroporphyrinogen III synthase [Candidatus Dactylopiibacterium carminicum]PAS96122.1 MAG: uroporphyrinogen III synthase [Candidatus Dactylopiibacterium carminicum]PAS98740.1 MAG: hypothetical protein BSR46_11670 [Candidatus Dactylopiibacterium carminicum]